MDSVSVERLKLMAFVQMQRTLNAYNSCKRKLTHLLKIRFQCFTIVTTYKYKTEKFWDRTCHRAPLTDCLPSRFGNAPPRAVIICCLK